MKAQSIFVKNYFEILCKKKALVTSKKRRPKHPKRNVTNRHFDGSLALMLKKKLVTQNEIEEILPPCPVQGTNESFNSIPIGLLSIG